jgi:ADP-heptose:LPS heptosyltransferase
LTLPAENDLPIHFFTIVLNGQPFIRYHIDVFKQLPFRWHWHVVEGVADFKHDTANWAARGGRITADFHENGHSLDGTSAYLAQLKERFPKQVSLYLKPSGQFWDGKLEMVNAPLPAIKEECLLWEVDSDELWTAPQICAARELFLAQPAKTAARYWCHFFVGPGLVVTSRNTYGNNPGEWLRTWRFKPGDIWTRHEPPVLARPAGAGGAVLPPLPRGGRGGVAGGVADLGRQNPFTNEETEAHGLVFQHFAYATEEALAFKEVYYGYQDARMAWQRLQTQPTFPIFLSHFFPWVKDACKVNRAKAIGLTPLASREWVFQTAAGAASESAAPAASWQPALFSEPGDLARSRLQAAAGNSAGLPDFGPVKRLLWIRTDGIGDSVLSMSMLPLIREKFKGARITAFCQERVAELFRLCPHVDEHIVFNKLKCLKDSSYRKEMILRLRAVQADLSLNPVFSRDWMDFAGFANGARYRLAWAGGLENMDPATREQWNRSYTHLFPNAEKNMPELERQRLFLRALGIEAPPLRPLVWLDEEAERFADDFFQKNSLDRQKTAALFACGVGGVLVSGKPSSREYPRLGAAISAVCRRENLALIALGGERDGAGNQAQLDAAGCKAFNLSGKISLSQSAALLKRCRLAVGVDTGLAHLACALEVPNAIVLGGGHFGRFQPYSPLTALACLPLECYHCDFICTQDRAYCIKELDAAVLREAFERTLAERSPKIRVCMPRQSAWPPKAGRPSWRMPAVLEGREDVEIIYVG